MKILSFIGQLFLSLVFWLVFLAAGSVPASIILAGELQKNFKANTNFSFKYFKENGKLISGLNSTFIKYQEVSIISQFIALIAIVFIILFLHKQKKAFKHLFSITHLKHTKTLIVSILLGVIFVGVSIGVSAITSDTTNSDINLHGFYSNIGIFSIFLSIGIFTPIMEEIVFRFLIYNAIQDYYSVKLSLIFTSIFFAIIHLGYLGKAPFPLNLLILFVLLTTSFYLGYLRFKLDSLIAPILFHILMNSVNLICMLYL